MSYQVYPTAPGPPHKICSYYKNDIESQEALRKNDEELDKLCKKICLMFGWCIVLCLFLYFIKILIK